MSMANGNEFESEGYDLLNKVWFMAIQELAEIGFIDPNAKNRIAACEVLLKYFQGMGQSINVPWIPAVKPDELIIGEKDEDE